MHHCLLIGLALWGCGESAIPGSNSTPSEAPQQPPRNMPNSDPEQRALPTQVDIRSVITVVAYHEGGETTATPRPQDSRTAAVDGDRIRVPVHVGHRERRAVFQDIAFVLRRTPEGLLVTPASETDIPTEGNVANGVREALAAQGVVLVPAGEWTSVLNIKDEVWWQVRWIQPGADAEEP